MDDFTSSTGIAEGTASLFVDSWRAGHCPAALERETDPCSMSQLNSECGPRGAAGAAEPAAAPRAPTAGCPRRAVRGDPLLGAGEDGRRVREVPRPGEPQALLQGGRGLRAAGRGRAQGPGLREAGRPRAVCPQRCVYQACNYEETFPHICAALGDYVHACASRGVLLRGWRDSVDNCSACGPGRGVSGARGGPGPAAAPGHRPGGLTSASPQPSPVWATRRSATTAVPAAARASHCLTAPPSATPAPSPWTAATVPRAPT